MKVSADGRRDVDSVALLGEGLLGEGAAASVEEEARIVSVSAPEEKSERAKRDLCTRFGLFSTLPEAPC